MKPWTTIILINVVANEAVRDDGALMIELRKLLSDYACEAEATIYETTQDSPTRKPKLAKKGEQRRGERRRGGERRRLTTST